MNTRAAGSWSEFREKWLPTIVMVAAALILLALSSWTDTNIFEKTKKEAFINAYLVVLSILFGFSFTSMSILISLISTNFGKGMCQDGIMDTLIKYHFECLLWCFAGIISAFFMFIWADAAYGNYLNAGFISIGCASLASAWRSIILLKAALHHSISLVK